MTWTIFSENLDSSLDTFLVYKTSILGESLFYFVREVVLILVLNIVFYHQRILRLRLSIQKHYAKFCYLIVESTQFTYTSFSLNYEYAFHKNYF